MLELRPATIAVVQIILALCLACGGIKFETGQTDEDAIASSEARARQIRAAWARQLQEADPVQIARMVKGHVDSVAARYVEYGHEVVANEWRQGNRGRGRPVPDYEMQEVVAAWVSHQQPIIVAYEDNLEFALQRTKETGFFGEDVLTLIRNLADRYYEVYSVVFYPAGTVVQYEERLQQVEQELVGASNRLDAELKRF
jgi:hypothetical protein